MKSQLIAMVQNKLTELESLCAYPADGDPSKIKARLNEVFSIIPGLKNDFEQLMDHIL